MCHTATALVHCRQTFKNHCSWWQPATTFALTVQMLQQFLLRITCKLHKCCTWWDACGTQIVRGEHWAGRTVEKTSVHCTTVKIVQGMGDQGGLVGILLITSVHCTTVWIVEGRGDQGRLLGILAHETLRRPELHLLTRANIPRKPKIKNLQGVDIKVFVFTNVF